MQTLTTPVGAARYPRILLLTICLLAPVSPLGAQTVAPVASVAEPKEPPAQLPPFIVEDDIDTGYAATNTLAGTRLRTNLRDVGAAISVVTSQFLADTASVNARDFLIYTTGTEAGGFDGNFSGVSTGTGFANAEALLQSPQNSTRVRGLAGADLTRDFFLTDIPLDAYNTERVDISRGANAILFGLGSPAGIINNQLKAANVRKNTFSYQQTYGRFESHREVLDLNSALLPKQLALRVIGLNRVERYRQEPAYEQDRRLFTSLRWEPKFVPAGFTQLQVSYEGGKANSNRPRPTPPHDGITEWYSVLNKVVIDPTTPTSVTNNPFLFAHLGSTGRWIGQIGAIFTDPASAVQGGNGVPPFMISRGGVPFTQMYAVGAYLAQGSNPNFFLNQQFAPPGPGLRRPLALPGTPRSLGLQLL